jgi:hypothetical protein
MENNIIHSAWEWRLRMNKCLLLDNCISIKYEDLILNNDFILNQILDFLDLKNKEKTKTNIDYFNSIGVTQKHLHKNVSNLPSSSIALKWKKELNNRDINLLTFLNKNELEKYNYEVMETNYLNVYLHLVFSFVHLVIYKVSRVIVVLITNPNNGSKNIRRRLRLMK